MEYIIAVERQHTVIVVALRACHLDGQLAAVKLDVMRVAVGNAHVSGRQRDFAAALIESAALRRNGTVRRNIQTAVSGNQQVQSEGAIDPGSALLRIGNAVLTHQLQLQEGVEYLRLRIRSPAGVDCDLLQVRAVQGQPGQPDSRDLSVSQELRLGFGCKGGMGIIRPVFSGDLLFVPISRHVDHCAAVAQDVACVLVGDVDSIAVLVGDADAVEGVHTAAVEGQVSLHGVVKVVFLLIAGVGIPLTEGEVDPFGGGGRNGLLPRLDDLDSVGLTGGVLQGGILVGHGDGLAVGVGDVGGHAEGAGGLDGLAAELGVLFQSQPAIVCAAGDMALRGDRAVERAAGDVAAEFLPRCAHVPIRVRHGDAAMENTAPYVALAGDVAGKDCAGLAVRVVDGVGDLDLSSSIEPVRSHIHRALHPAAVGIEEAAGMAGDTEVVKIHIDCGAVGGRAARDAGILPQLQLSKVHHGHAAAAFRLAAGDHSVQNRYLVCVASDKQATAAFACLAVLDAAAGDPDGTPGCRDAAAGHGRAAADDAALHGKGSPGVNVYAAAVGAVVGGEDAVPDGAAGHGDGAALGIDAAAERGNRSALDAAGIDGAARQHEGRARLHIHAAAIVIVGLSRAAVIPVSLAAGDETARGQSRILMLRLGAAVAQGQGMAPRDAEDAVRVRLFVIAQDIAVQVHGDIPLDVQPGVDGDVLRQLHDVARAGQCGGQFLRRGDLRRRQHLGDMDEGKEVEKAGVFKGRSTGGKFRNDTVGIVSVTGAVILAECRVQRRFVREE